MIFKEMTDNQRRVFIDTVQLHEAFVSAFNKNLSYRGGMHWKKSKSREYLFRSRDRFGYGKSLGPRSPETEKILTEFQQNKQRGKKRLSAPKQLLKKEVGRMGGPGDLEAVEIRNLQWLISSPKFSQVVIGDDGYPAPLVVPDPRAFALHKLWLSEQADREPVKKQRDCDQGLAVAQLIIQYLPNYHFKTSDLRMFPKDVVRRAKERISYIDLPVGINEK